MEVHLNIRSRMFPKNSDLPHRQDFLLRTLVLIHKSFFFNLKRAFY